MSVELLWQCGLRWPRVLVTLGRRAYYDRWLCLGPFVIWWQG